MKYHHFFPKKCALKLLSIPITLKPFAEKNLTDSDPINPLDPVTIQMFIIIYILRNF